MRMALPWPSLKVPFWDAFRPGSSMPSAALAPGPLLPPPSPQLPGLGLGEEGEEAVPLANILADGAAGARALSSHPRRLRPHSAPWPPAHSSLSRSAWE